ncbi:hypothetical protein cypCar_00032638 [Cyprinus carpio]|nr:hypothetical protein cypCar_00032638 [Cyprinus carpio]
MDYGIRSDISRGKANRQKSDQPPQAKKPKVKTRRSAELPIDNNHQWQLANDSPTSFVKGERGTDDHARTSLREADTIASTYCGDTCQMEGQTAREYSR